MPTSIKLDDRLAEKVAALAAEAGLPIDTFVERVLQGLIDADIELRDGIPLFRMPPGAPVPDLRRGRPALAHRRQFLSGRTARRERAGRAPGADSLSTTRSKAVALAASLEFIRPESQPRSSCRA